jgi:hypothetical protein
VVAELPKCPQNPALTPYMQKGARCSPPCAAAAGQPVTENLVNGPAHGLGTYHKSLTSISTAFSRLFWRHRDSGLFCFNERGMLVRTCGVRIRPLCLSCELFTCPTILPLHTIVYPVRYNAQSHQAVSNSGHCFTQSNPICSEGLSFET